MKSSLFVILLLTSLLSLIFQSCKEEDGPDDTSVTIVTGSFVDDRDGHSYKWVQIGDQVWMAENLAYLPSVNPPSDESNWTPYWYVYGYNGSLVNEAKASPRYATFGVLYNWPAALTACPDGWHLPGDTEWEKLAQYVSIQKKTYGKYSEDDWSAVGGHLKATGTIQDGDGLWLKKNPRDKGTDDFGFSALPGGLRYLGGNFSYVGNYGYWWSSTEYSETHAWLRSLTYGYGIFYRYNNFEKAFGFSIRCIKDGN